VRPAERGAEVVVVPPELVEDRWIGPGSLRPRVRRLREPDEVLGVLPRNRLGALRAELLERELPDRCQHREAISVQADQALLAQRPQDRLGRAAHFACSCCGPAAAERGEAREKLPVFLRKQAVAPLDRGADRLLPRRHVDRTADQQPETLFEPRPQLRRREILQSRPGQFDRERQAVEGAADVGDVTCVRLRHVEAPHNRACPRREEAHRVVLFERRDAVFPLPG
jgi:hypothetical protein